MTRLKHLTVKLGEEGAEVAHAAGKCALFGPKDTHPKREDRPAIDLLIEEVNDVLAVAEMLLDELPAHVPRPCPVELGDREQINRKKQRVREWMGYAYKLGRIGP